MGKAEGFEDGFTSNWGAVSILFNPEKNVDEKIMVLWRNFMSSKLNRSLLSKHLKTETPPIDSGGFLNIKWPEELTPKGSLDNIDFLLATVTKPSLKDGRYPSADEISKAMNKAYCYNYFGNNV